MIDANTLLVEHVAPSMRYSSTWENDRPRATFKQRDGWEFSLEVLESSAPAALVSTGGGIDPAAAKVRDDQVKHLKSISEPGDTVYPTSVGTLPATAIKEAGSSTWYTAVVDVVTTGTKPYHVDAAGNLEVQAFQGALGAMQQYQILEDETVKVYEENPDDPIPALFASQVESSLQPPSSEELAEYRAAVGPAPAGKVDLWQDHAQYGLEMVAVLDYYLGSSRFSAVDAAIFADTAGQHHLALPPGGGGGRDGRDGPVLGKLTVASLTPVQDRAWLLRRLQPYMTKFEGLDEERLMRYQVERMLRTLGL